MNTFRWTEVFALTYLTKKFVKNGATLHMTLQSLMEMLQCDLRIIHPKKGAFTVLCLLVDSVYKSVLNCTKTAFILPD